MPIIDIGAEDLCEMIKNKKDQVEIIDVREPEEYAVIHFKDSKLIPMGELLNRLDEIDWNKEVIFICRFGNRSKLIAETVGAGKEIKNLLYGIYEYFKSGDKKDLVIDDNLIEEYF
jgi:rhodanese-related sulfurtransferase